MPLFRNSGRKDTGRTDKYSDETPLKDYQDYRKDYPKEKETARAEKKANPEALLNKENKEVQKALQYSQSIQNWKINEQELENKVNELIIKLKKEGADESAIDNHIKRFLTPYLNPSLLRIKFIR
jgi:hypothetical protein